MIMILSLQPVAYTQICPFDLYYLALLSRFPAPLAWIYMSQLCPFLADEGYFNSIDDYLLGYLHYSPFLALIESYLYPLGTTFPYFGSPYQTTFPYTALPDSMIPYARFDYPAYVYGSPDFYLNWVLLQ
jgi:hypothetical protein